MFIQVFMKNTVCREGIVKRAVSPPMNAGFGVTLSFGAGRLSGTIESIEMAAVLWARQMNLLLIRAHLRSQRVGSHAWGVFH